MAARSASGSREDRVEVKGEQDSSRDRGDGPEPKRAPPAAARPKLPAAILGDKGGADVTVPLLTLAALLAIAFGARSAIRSHRS